MFVYGAVARTVLLPAGKLFAGSWRCVICSRDWLGRKVDEKLVGCPNIEGQLLVSGYFRI